MVDGWLMASWLRKSWSSPSPQRIHEAPDDEGLDPQSGMEINTSEK